MAFPPQLSSQDPGRAPLLLSAECQRSGTVTRVSLDYHCCPATAPSTQLAAVQVLLPLDHTATDLQCQPPASWSAPPPPGHVTPFPPPEADCVRLLGVFSVLKVRDGDRLLPPARKG